MKNSIQSNLFTNVEASFKVFRALNHKMRRRIIEMLEEHDRLTVTDIYIKLRVVQSIASSQLGILRKAGFLTTEKEGKFVFYSVNQERVKEVTDMMEALNAPKKKEG